MAFTLGWSKPIFGYNKGKKFQKAKGCSQREAHIAKINYLYPQGR
jgi:hypothetical protein